MPRKWRVFKQNPTKPSHLAGRQVAVDLGSPDLQKDDAVPGRVASVPLHLFVGDGNPRSGRINGSLPAEGSLKASDFAFLTIAESSR
jgi:hypothetical protein